MPDANVLKSLLPGFAGLLKDLLPRLKNGFLAAGRHASSAVEREEALCLANDRAQPGFMGDAAKLLEIAESRPDAQRSPEDYMILATEAFRMQDYEKCLDCCFAGLRLRPEDNRVQACLRNCMGKAFQAMGAVVPAINNFDLSVGLNPDFPGSFYNLGEMYFQQNRLGEAETKLKDAIRLDGNNPDYRQCLGKVYWRLKKYDLAESEFKEAIRLNGADAESHLNLGRIYYEQMSYSRAKEHFARALEIKVGNPVPYTYMGHVLFKQGKYGEAERQYREAVLCDSGNADIRNCLGDALYLQKLYYQAEAEYREAVRLDPRNARAHKNLGHVYMEQKRYSEAEESFKQAIKLDPQLAIPLINLRIRPESAPADLPIEESERSEEHV